jgi:hypothetical protein
VHKATIRRSVYNDYILDLSLQFKRMHPPEDQELPSPFRFSNCSSKEQGKILKETVTVQGAFDERPTQPD